MIGESETELRTVASICRDWKASLLRCQLECTEAADDDEAAVAAACGRADARHDALYEELEGTHWRPSPDETIQLINLAILLIKEDGIHHRDRAIRMLEIARNGVVSLVQP